MSSLPPPTTVVLAAEQATEVSSDPELTVPTIILSTNKKHLLRQQHYRHPSASYDYDYSPLSAALQSDSSLSYASTTHYRPAPEASSSLREIMPIPDAIGNTRAFTLAEPFLFPLLFPLGCCSAILQSIYMVLPVFPAAVIVGLAGSIIIPFICIGTISVTAVVVFKAIMRMIQKQIQGFVKLGRDVVGAMERVARLYRDGVVMLRCLARSRGSRSDDDRRTTTERRHASRRASRKPGPSILKPTRPIVQVYEDLPPCPLPLPMPTVRPRAASFSGSPTPAPVKIKAREVFRSNLEKEKQMTITQQQLLTPPGSDHTPSPPFGVLDIPSLTFPSPEEEEVDCHSPAPSQSYFSNPRYSVSSIDLTASTTTSSNAPTPRTPGSPLVQSMQKLVKHVRIVEPCEMEEPTICYFEDDDDAQTRPLLREFAAAKLQDALGLLQTGAGQVWGS